MTQLFELTLPAVASSARDARDAIGAIVRELGGSEQTIYAVRLCVSEAATNVVRHAYGEEGGDFTVRAVHSDEELTIVIRDEGRGMTPFQRDGELGYGLRIIDRFASRSEISSAPELGTEVRMTFALDALLDPMPSARVGSRGS